MILKSKRTQKRIELSYPEFQTRFAKEIRAALDSYKQTINNKSYFKTNKNLEADFYFDLQWNFNHFGISVWFIEKL